MQGGEDANPLNRRLPAEVVTRQSKVKKVIEKISDDVQVDLKVALSLKPEARLRWLSKAFKMVEERKVTSTDLYDIVSNRKFCGTMQSKNSQKLRAIIAESMGVFSDKQQRFLRSDEWAPNKNDEDRDANEGDSSAAPELPEESSSAATLGAAADSKRDDSKGAAEERDGGGGWTWTVRERPLPNTTSSSTTKKKSGSQDTEVSIEKTSKKTQALSQKQQEEEVDDSLQLLERLKQHKVEEQPPPVARDRRREEPKKRRRERSRSRSISAASVSSSSRGHRRGKRRKDSGKKGGAVNFEDALRRRMQERESQIETSRLPVVDPGHAKKAWR